MQEIYKRSSAVPWQAEAKAKPVPWLVHEMILKGGITALLGPEKSGKSRFIGWLLAQMLGMQVGGPVLRSSNGEIFTSHTGFSKILYLNAEEQTEAVMARINAYAIRCGFAPKDDWPIMCLPAAAMQLQRVSDRQEFEREFIAPKEFDIVLVDPLRRVHAGNENDNSAMAGLHNDIRRWSQRYGQSWVLVHHSPKFREDDDLERIATWSRGNTDLVTLLDGAIMMRNLGGNKQTQRRMLKRMGRFPPLDDLVLLDHGDPSGFVVQG